METVTDSDKIAPWSGGLRCNAKSKRSQQQCKNTAITNATKCRMHGGKSEGRPSNKLSHGLASDFIRKKDLPEIVARARALDTAEGRAEAVKLGHALTSVRAEAIPEGELYHDVYFRAMGTALKHVETLHGLEVKEQAPQLPNFVVLSPDAAQLAPFEARTLEGHCTVRMLDGKPFVFDGATGGWMPATLRKDADSGVEYYDRVLTLPPAEPSDA
jgi:hypothetical protein